MLENISVKNWRYIIFVFSFLLYVNTFGHDYALDDKIAITENEFTKKGISGIKDLVSEDSMVGFFGTKKNLVAGGRYRPLALITHAIEWQFFGENPFVSHFLNALLYGICCVLLFVFLKSLFQVQKLQLPWHHMAVFATLLFLVHPLHVEVVANIKGRDDVLCLIGGLGTLIWFLKYYDTSKAIWLLPAGLALFLSLLAKESTVTFLAIAPLSIYFFRKINFKKLTLAMGALLGFFLIYLFVRWNVIGSAQTEIAKELMNNPFLNATNAEKFATIFYTFWLYLKLIFVPYPLTHDYYPLQIPIINFADLRAVLPLVLHLGILIYGLVLSLKKHPVGYGILFYFITFSLYTNIVFPIGTFMNDRFMFLPSIGSAIVVAFLIHRLIENQKVKNVFPAIVGFTLLFSYSALTFSRNFVWKDDFTLATTDVLVSSKSAKNNMSAGLAYLDRAKEQNNEQLKRKDLLTSLPYFEKSIALYPTYMPPTLLMGNAYTELKEYTNALQYYKRCIAINPEYGYTLNNLERLGDLARIDGNFEQAKNAYQLLIQTAPHIPGIYGKLGELIGKDLGDPQQALPYIEKGLEQEPKNTDLMQKLGVVYAITGNVSKAIEVFEQAYALDTNNARVLMNLGLAHNSIGNTNLGNAYLEKAFTKEPSLAGN